MKGFVSMTNTRTVLAVLALTTALSGCSLAPDFKLPFIQSSPEFKESLTTVDAEKVGTWKVAEPSAHLDRGAWWLIFKDETLNKLEDDAIAGNPGLQAMAARVQQARAIAEAAGASMFPSVNLDASATRQHINGAAFGTSGSIATTDIYNANLGLAYELDLFGRVRNTTTAAKADAKSSEELLNSTKLALQADVATLYFTLRSLDTETALLEKALALRTDNMDILNKRLEVGTITALDTAQATVDLETTRSQLQAVTQQRKEAAHALAILLGKAPAEFTLDSASLPKDIPVVPAGVPSDVLQRRPDIASAAATLAAANARIGVARAAFFPSISLTASGGYQSTELGDLFDWSSRAWSIGPQVSLPIFRGGELIANNKRARAVYDESVALYREQVLVAFKDVEDSLSRLKTYADQAKAQATAEEAAHTAQDIASLRYESGDVGYLEDITAKQNALTVERNGIAIQSGRLIETVSLIRAIGGGWDAAAVKAVEETEAKPETVAPVTPENTTAPATETPAPVELKSE